MDDRKEFLCKDGSLRLPQLYNLTLGIPSIATIVPYLFSLEGSMGPRRPKSLSVDRRASD